MQLKGCESFFVSSAVWQLSAACLVALFAVRPAAASPGDLDPSFGAAGIVITPIGSASDFANAIIQQHDGKLVAAGGAYVGGHVDFALARYDLDGNLDPSFGDGGIVVLALSDQDDRALALVQQPDGKLVVAGSTIAGTSGSYHYAFALVRFLSDGTVDPSFGDNGRVITAVGGYEDLAYALIQQEDGKLVAAGHAQNPSSSHNFALARYDEDGYLDSSFGNGGLVTTAVTVNGDEARALAQQADGKLVVAGFMLDTSGGNPDYDFAVVRYNEDGSLDTSFDGDGIVTTGFASTHPVSDTRDDHATAIALTDGKIIVGGSTSPGTYPQFALARYNPDGSLDSSFDSDGKVVTAVGSANAAVYGLLVQDDGVLVAAGLGSPANGNADFGLVRYLSNGSLDSTFGTGGKVLTGVSSPYSSDSAKGLLQQADGKLVVAGATYDGTGTTLDFALVRYLVDGAPNASPTSTATPTAVVPPTEVPTMALSSSPTNTAMAPPTSSPTSTATPPTTISPTGTPTVSSVPALCALVPLTDCMQASSARLQLRAHPERPSRRRLTWSFRGNLPSNLGDPTRNTTYAYCLYDDDNLIHPLQLEPGPGWRAARSGFAYRGERSARGITKVKLASGDSLTRIVVRGAGEGLSFDLPLQQTSSVRAQLVADTGGERACWEAILSPPTWRSSSERFVDGF